MPGSPLVEALKNKEYSEEKLVIIFDFNDKLIYSGYANRLPGSDDPTQQIGLMTYGQDWTVKLAQKKYDESPQNSEQIIDFDRQLKTWIIHRISKKQRNPTIHTGLRCFGVSPIGCAYMLRLSQRKPSRKRGFTPSQL